MPNHCYQQVTIKGPRALVSQIEENLEEGRFCDLISPMPFEMWIAPDQGGLGAWYEWRNENWGTKWDVCSVEVEIADSSLNRPDRRTLEFRCWTAWAPPIPVWDRLVDLGCKVEADYQDEGGMFEGTYRDGLDECWVPADVYEEDEVMNLDKDVYEEEE